MNKLAKLFLGGFFMLSMSLSNAAEAAKAIVIYFSHTGENYSVGVIQEGNTAKVAKEIARQTGAAVWEIKEAEPYPVKYNDCIARAKKELQSKARPAFQGTAPDLAGIDTIYIGYPNWWGDAPMVVYTFLEKAKVDGKTILPFCTHEGSGLGSTARNLAKAFPKAKVEQNGLSIYGHIAQNDADAVKSAVEGWLKKLGKLK
jgi:flavodoxin